MSSLKESSFPLGQRDDFLSITTDEILAQSNRGFYLRALKEVESNALTFTLSTGSEKEMRFHWSDGFTCQFPHALPFREGFCSCKLQKNCRHLIRSLLAWQRAHPSKTRSESPQKHEPPPFSETSSAYQDQVESLWQRGLDVEIDHGHPLKLTLINLNQKLILNHHGDESTVFCSCGKQAPCIHSGLAARILQEIPPGETPRFWHHSPHLPRLSSEDLEPIQILIFDLIRTGAGHLPDSWFRRCEHLESQFRTFQHSQVSDLLHQARFELQQLSDHHPQFSSDRLLNALAGVLIQIQQLQLEKPWIPVLEAPTSTSESPQSLPPLTCHSLGLERRRDQHGKNFIVVLQDQCGNLHDVVEPARTSRQDILSELALSQSTLMIYGALKTLHSPRLDLSGARILPLPYLPQKQVFSFYASPIGLQTFSEVRERHRELPPFPFRPPTYRSLWQACPIQSLQNLHFDRTTQQYHGTLTDLEGQDTLMVLPWDPSHQVALENFLVRLANAQDTPKYLVGKVFLERGRLTWTPTRVHLFDSGLDNPPTVLSPWIDSMTSISQATPLSHQEQRCSENHFDNPRLAPLESIETLSQLLAEFILQGFDRLSPDQIQNWNHASRLLIKNHFPKLGSTCLKVFNSANSSPLNFSRIMMILPLLKEIHPI